MSIPSKFFNGGLRQVELNPLPGANAWEGCSGLSSRYSTDRVPWTEY